MLLTVDPSEKKQKGDSSGSLFSGYSLIDRLLLTDVNKKMDYCLSSSPNGGVNNEVGAEQPDHCPKSDLFIRQ